jgi:hypothetical protein
VTTEALAQLTGYRHAVWAEDLTLVIFVHSRRPCILEFSQRYRKSRPDFGWFRLVLLRTSLDERFSSFSPDGKSLSYVSRVSVRFQAHPSGLSPIWLGGNSERQKVTTRCGRAADASCSSSPWIGTVEDARMISRYDPA